MDADLVCARGQVDRMLGRVGSRAGKNAGTVTDFVHRGFIQLEPLVVRERGRLPGGARDDETVRSRVDQMGREAAKPLEVDRSVSLERRDYCGQDLSQHALDSTRRKAGILHDQGVSRLPHAWHLLDLAVAFVMGLAFAALITSFVDNLVMPIVAMIIGKPDFSDLTFNDVEADFGYGAFITAAITFLATAAAIFFFLVKPVNALMSRMKTPRRRRPPTRSAGTRSFSRPSTGSAASRSSRARAGTTRVVRLRGRRSGSRRSDPRAREPHRVRRARQLDRIPVDPGRERRERDSAATQLLGGLEGAAVGRREELRLAVISSKPHRADRVDDVARRKATGARRLRVASSRTRPTARTPRRSRLRPHGGSRRKHRRPARALRSPH